MDNSPPDQEHSSQDLSPGELFPALPERRPVRRRLVQSTLFPPKPQPPELEANGERDSNEDDGGGEDEECCGSQSKRKRKPKGKSTPTKRSSEKVKGKRSRNNTPKKDLANMQGEDAPIVIPNLRLEARMTAEENSRLFAGKQMHPFFSSCKVGKKSQEVIDLDSKQFAAVRDNKEMTCGPIHVFERTQDKEGPLDWRTWAFREGIFMKSNCVLESTRSSIFEGSVECLRFDKLPTNSDPRNTSLFHDEVSFDQCPIQQECLYEMAQATFDISDDEKVVCYKPLKDSDSIQINYSQDRDINKVDPFNGHTDLARKPDIGQQNRFLEERMKSYYIGCSNQPKDGLWIYKYQPKKALEVCGNNESVKFLSEWLQHWHERDSRISKEVVDCVMGDMEDNNYLCSESDSDSENKHEKAGPKNVLLVTGPIGSGKSAAIYACAREQGFEVLEVSASECRNGALVKQRFGEALESRQLKRSLANPMGSLNKHIYKPCSNLANGTATQELEDEVVEFIPLADENCRNATGESDMSDCKEAGSCSRQSELKPLILFEDVDITFPEDRGFIAAVQLIAETAKGPIVLTSNSHNPFLPDNLDRKQICFTPPSPEELLCHVYMVCAAERANIQSHLLERFVGYCQGDIRKTIMHLQFWCQGRTTRKARKSRRTCGSLLFDLEAVHQILPKLIPWELPSPLSELVDKEITASLSGEGNCLMEATGEEQLDKRETEFSFMHNNEMETIEAKKAEMLSRNCSVHDYDEFRAQLDTVPEFSDNSDTPFSCSRRIVRKNQDMILSSDSEDEKIGNRCNIFTNRDTNNGALPEESPSFKELPCSAAADMDEEQHRDTNNGALPEESPSFKELPCSAASDMDEEQHYFSEAAGCIPIYDECKSLDVSCVPESSFVPETEFYDGTEVHLRTMSCDNVGDTMEEVSVSNNRIPVEADYQDVSKSEQQKHSDTFISNTYIVAEFCEQEEMDDSHNEHVEAVAIGNQVMDESSHMEFRRLRKFVEKSKPLVLTDSVQKSWNQLRSRRADLAQYARSEEQHPLQIVKLADNMSNLISETDVLLSNCQPLTNDSLEPSTIPSEESDTYSFYDKGILASTAQHGFCFYAKDIAAVGSTIDSVSTVDLASEMLASETGMMALGKLAGHDMATTTGRNSQILEKSDISSKSGNASSVFDVIQSIVPSKSCMALKGAAYYEYLSSLRCMSRSEASRLSEEKEKPRKRRGRTKRHYLSTGTLMMTPEEISLLGQINMS